MLSWQFGRAAHLKEMLLLKGEFKCIYPSVTYVMVENKQELKKAVGLSDLCYPWKLYG